MIKTKFDRVGKFIAKFNTENGDYMRTGVLKRGEETKMEDTGVDPFLAEYPELIDVGIMGQ